jgi:polyhydroxyalkanoate synthesis repressor PhaR
VTQKEDDAVVVIRRYGNRRLYDTRASAYVNLTDVRALVREGKKIRVVDANTEEDVTRRVLTQIVLESAEEDGKGGGGLPLELLYELTRASDRAFRDFLDWYLKSSHEVYQRLQERWQADARRRWGDARPAFEAWAQLWDPRQVAASLSQLLSPFERRAPGPGAAQSADASARSGEERKEQGGAQQPASEIDDLRRRLDELERRLAGERTTGDGDSPPPEDPSAGGGKPRRS